MNKSTKSEPNNVKAALDYHALPTPGKLSVAPTKRCETQEDLALTYTPGVAEPLSIRVSHRRITPRIIPHFLHKGH